MGKREREYNTIFPWVELRRRHNLMHYWRGSRVFVCLPIRIMLKSCIDFHKNFYSFRNGTFIFTEKHDGRVFCFRFAINKTNALGKQILYSNSNCVSTIVRFPCVPYIRLFSSLSSIWNVISHDDGRKFSSRKIVFCREVFRKIGNLDDLCLLHFYPNNKRLFARSISRIGWHFFRWELRDFIASDGSGFFNQRRWSFIIIRLRMFMQIHILYRHSLRISIL